eukprot:20109-Heterococcus_DN1.PRE.1
MYAAAQHSAEGLLLSADQTAHTTCQPYKKQRSSFQYEADALTLRVLYSYAVLRLCTFMRCSAVECKQAQQEQPWSAIAALLALQAHATVLQQQLSEGARKHRERAHPVHSNHADTL